MESMTLQYLLLVLLAIAALIDFHTYKVPNLLTVPAILVGLSWHTLTSQLSGFVFSLEGAVLGLSLFAILYMCGWMGAGDVKLFAAVGSFLGPAQTISAAIVIALVGGLLAFLVLGFHQGWRKTTLWLWSYIQAMFLTRTGQRLTLAQDNAPKVPYGLAIGLGTIGSYWWYPFG